jgi:DNA-binding LacI/PurR family transcriptional regulator
LSDLARLAVQTMLDLCDGKNSDLEVVNLCLPTRLIERDSVATVQQ